MGNLDLREDIDRHVNVSMLAGIIFIVAILSLQVIPSFGNDENPITGPGKVQILDHNFNVEIFVSGLSTPTTMTFVGDDILILQKDDGKVRLVRDGVLQEQAVLDLSVYTKNFNGLLGIVSVENTVYLLFSESETDGGEELLRKRIVKYTWDGQMLIDPVLVKELLPLAPKSFHQGGVMVVGLDNTVFAIIGDLNRQGILQNFPTEVHINDTGVILRVDPEGPYYAMGIRNSFGLAVDPVTGYLWETDNGPESLDEINMFKPNSNGGWKTVLGPATEPLPTVNIPGHGDYVYSDPVFTWEDTVAPTAISFVDSKPFENYRDSVFVGICQGDLYRFELNPSRTGFVFDDPALEDLVADIGDGMNEIKLATGLGCITDIEVGPDGLLYIVSLWAPGTIYKISPVNVFIPSGVSTPGCEATNSCYDPFSIQVNIGDTVTWRNEDMESQTVTSGNPSDGADGIFDSGLILPDGTFSYTFTEAGTFPYFSTISQWMTGEVIVVDVGEAEEQSIPIAILGWGALAGSLFIAAAYIIMKIKKRK